MKTTAFRKAASIATAITLLIGVSLFNPAAAAAPARYITTTVNGTVSVVVLITTPASVLMVSVMSPVTFKVQFSTSKSVVLLEAKLGLMQASLVSTTMFDRKSLPPK